MNTVTIVSGNFSKSGNNFTGYNAVGERIHVPMRQMENLGYNKDSKVEFPLYAVVVEREFNTLGADGKPTDETFKRLQAGSLFKTKAELIEAANADKVLAIETKSALVKQASTAGLSEEAINALTNAAF